MMSQMKKLWKHTCAPVSLCLVLLSVRLSIVLSLSPVLLFLSSTVSVHHWNTNTAQIKSNSLINQLKVFSLSGVCHEFRCITFIMVWKHGYTVHHKGCRWSEWPQVSAHSLFTCQHLLKPRPLLLQLAEAFSQLRHLLSLLSASSHGDNCLCCHGKPRNDIWRGLDLLIQSAATLCWLGVSSAVLQPLIGGERSRSVMKLLSDCVCLDG